MKPTKPKRKKRASSKKRAGAAPRRSKRAAGATTAKKPSPATSFSVPSSAGPSGSASAPSGSARGRGRPTDYQPEYADKAFKLCLLGAKDKEIAEFFGVTESTLNLWKQVHEEFSESMRAGKEEADATIAKSLYHRAKGYEHPEVHVSNYQGSITLTPLVKHYPPDTQAASLWLRNRQPARWRDKVDHELSGPNGGPIKTESDVTLNPSDAYLRLIGK